MKQLLSLLSGKRTIQWFVALLLLLPLAGCMPKPSDMCDMMDTSGIAVDTTDNCCYIITEALTIPSSADEYKVSMATPGGTAPGTLGIIRWVIQSIKDIIVAARNSLFYQWGQNSGYMKVLEASLHLSIALYAALVLLGAVKATSYNLVMFLIKWILVMALPRNLPFFNELIIYNFEMLVNGLTCFAADAFSGAICTGFNDPSVAVFGMFDRLWTMFTGPEFFGFLLALLFTGNFGWLYALVMIGLLFGFIALALTATRIFILALIARNLLYTLGPLFVIFLLFNSTRSLFVGWLENITSFTLQPIFLFAYVGIFLSLVVGFIENAIFPSVSVGATAPYICYREWIKFSSFIQFFFWWRIVDDPITGTSIGGWNPQIPLNLWGALTLLLICWMSVGMGNWLTKVAANLAGGVVNMSSPNYMWPMMQGVRNATSFAAGGAIGMGQGMYNGVRGRNSATGRNLGPTSQRGGYMARGWAAGVGGMRQGAQRAFKSYRSSSQTGMQRAVRRRNL